MRLNADEDQMRKLRKEEEAFSQWPEWLCLLSFTNLSFLKLQPFSRFSRSQFSVSLQQSTHTRFTWSFSMFSLQVPSTSASTSSLRPNARSTRISSRKLSSSTSAFTFSISRPTASASSNSPLWQRMLAHFRRILPGSTHLYCLIFLAQKYASRMAASPPGSSLALSRCSERSRQWNTSQYSSGSVIRSGGTRPISTTSSSNISLLPGGTSRTSFSCSYPYSGDTTSRSFSFSLTPLSPSSRPVMSLPLPKRKRVVLWPRTMGVPSAKQTQAMHSRVIPGCTGGPPPSLRVYLTRWFGIMTCSRPTSSSSPSPLPSRVREQWSISMIIHNNSSLRYRGIEVSIVPGIYVTIMPSSYRSMRPEGKGKGDCSHQFPCPSRLQSSYLCPPLVKILLIPLQPPHLIKSSRSVHIEARKLGDVIAADQLQLNNDAAEAVEVLLSEEEGVGLLQVGQRKMSVPELLRPQSEHQVVESAFLPIPDNRLKLADLQVEQKPSRSCWLFLSQQLLSALKLPVLYIADLLLERRDCDRVSSCFRLLEISPEYFQWLLKAFLNSSL